MEYNKSLSARIRRRNKCGFSGLGTGKIIINREIRSFNSIRASQAGDYTDPAQNHKDVDYANDKRHKDKVGFKKVLGINNSFAIVNKRAMCKKFADNHQKMS